MKIYFLFKLFKFSAFLDRATTLGFYLDWFFQINNGLLGLMLVFVAGSIFIGMFFYIAAMVSDMKMRIDAIEKNFKSREIRFHVEIIE